jgi:hypothetical protein
MADRFYSLVKGESSTWQVTEGSSTSSEAVELRVNDSIYTTKLDVILMLQVLEDYLNTVETSPIA